MEVEVIRKLLKKELETGRKQIDLANKIGVSHATIYKLLNTNTSPTTNTIRKIAAYFNLSLADLMSGTRKVQRPCQGAGETVRKVPIIRRMKDIQPDAPGEAAVEYIWLTDVQESAYLITVKDDAMAPAIKKGDCVLFTPGQEAEEGTVVVAEDEWGDLMVRRVRRRKDKTFLAGENQEYQPVQVSKKIRIVGRATETLSRRKI